MSAKQGKLGRVLVAGAMVGAVAVTHCSSSSGGSAADGGPDGPQMVVLRPDGSSGSSGSSSGSGGSSGSSGASSSSGGSVGTDAASAGLYDGTVGKACQSNADCASAGGPGVNRCSISAGFTAGPLWPTAVCILSACDPVGTGNGQIQFCDGPATSTSSPGICLPTTNPAMANMGVCVPQCQFASDGSAPTGCPGKDVCNAAAFATTSSGQVAGFGYCLGGCKTDSDCPASSKCQVDEGTCLTTLKTRTKVLGQACTPADTTSGACFCDSNTTTNQGSCTQFCTAGPSGVACPTGYLCDTFETSQLTLASDGGTIPGFAQQNAGLAGICRRACQAGSDGGGACPASSTCDTAPTVGPDCVP